MKLKLEIFAIIPGQFVFSCTDEATLSNLAFPGVFRKNFPG